jgi:hypothetical protein
VLYRSRSGSIHIPASSNQPATMHRRCRRREVLLG